MGKAMTVQRKGRTSCAPCGKWSHHHVNGAISACLYGSIKHGTPMRFYLCPYDPSVYHVTKRRYI